MRVLMVSQFYPPTVGGQEQVVRNMSAALARRGHEVSVATFDNAAAAVCDPGVTVHTMPNFWARFAGQFADAQRPHTPPAPDPTFARAFAALIARERPDVIHTHDWLVHSSIRARTHGRIPLVLSLHDYGWVCANKRLMRDGSVCSGPGLAKCVACAARFYGPKGILVAGALAARHRRVRAAVDHVLPVSSEVARRSGLRAGIDMYTVLPNFLP
ncbi:MAG TPA: glycosyltransferase, partial [Acidimicrobiia bacterium]|nr:glycosyltransferase [Acidimicrobiia bacterium]